MTDKPKPEVLIKGKELGRPNGLTFDGATHDPMQEAVRDALLAFMAASAQAQAEAAREAQRAGIEAAKKDGTKYRGKKPSYNREALETVTHMLGNDAGASEIAKATGISKSRMEKIVNGHIANPNEQECISNFLGIKIDHLSAAFKISGRKRKSSRKIPLDSFDVGY